MSTAEINQINTRLDMYQQQIAQIEQELAKQESLHSDLLLVKDKIAQKADAFQESQGRKRQKLSLFQALSTTSKAAGKMFQRMNEAYQGADFRSALQAIGEAENAVHREIGKVRQKIMDLEDELARLQNNCARLQEERALCKTDEQEAAQAQASSKPE